MLGWGWGRGRLYNADRIIKNVLAEIVQRYQDGPRWPPPLQSSVELHQGEFMFIDAPSSANLKNIVHGPRVS